MRPALNRKPRKGTLSRLALRKRVRRWTARMWSTSWGIRILATIKNSPLLVALFYYLQGSFYPEQKGVLAGQLAYFRAFESAQSAPLHGLRRNVHRLEKGLSMQERRPVFAEGYIAETIAILTRIMDQGALRTTHQTTVQWAVDVIDRYFSKIHDSEITGHARQAFYDLLVEHQLQPGQQYPYQRNSVQKSTLAYEELLQLARQRRSVRWFQNQVVPRELLDKALEIAKLSPSGCNRQAFKFRIFEDMAIVKKLVDLPGGMAGYGHQVPCVVVVTGQLSAYFHERDRHLIYIDASLATMAFMFALESLGLSSCGINWPNLPEKDDAISALIDLPEDERVVMMIAVGFAADNGLIPYSAKKSLNELRVYQSRSE